MITDKNTGKEMTSSEIATRLNSMTEKEKLALLDEIYKQLNIQPIKSGIL